MHRTLFQCRHTFIVNRLPVLVSSPPREPEPEPEPAPEPELAPEPEPEAEGEISAESGDYAAQSQAKFFGA